MPQLLVGVDRVLLSEHLLDQILHNRLVTHFLILQEPWLVWLLDNVPSNKVGSLIIQEQLCLQLYFKVCNAGLLSLVLSLVVEEIMQIVSAARNLLNLKIAEDLLAVEVDLGFVIFMVNVLDSLRGDTLVLI